MTPNIMDEIVSNEMDVEKFVNCSLGICESVRDVNKNQETHVHRAYDYLDAFVVL